MDKNKYLYIYADIFFTRGYNRTMMLNLKDNTWHFITNDFYDTILLFKYNTIDYVLNKNPYDVNVQSLIDYFLNNQLASIVDDLSLFPPIQQKWYSPHIIENAIIDIDIESKHDYRKIAIELEELLCRNIQFRLYTTMALDNLEDILSNFINKDFSSIDVLIKYDSSITPKDYLLLAKKYPSVSFVVHTSPLSSFHESLLKDVYPIVGYVQFIKQEIFSSDCCGIINNCSMVHPNNVHDYMEGVLRNKCLNKKISIDTKGNIKNCPSMKHIYGNIKHSSLIDVCKNKSFRSYWYLNKEKIKICKDCEYRNVCNDCRAFIKNKYEKPLKCNYNPYNLSWDNEKQT